MPKLTSGEVHIQIGTALSGVCTMLISENQLDNWVRGSSEEAQGVIPELIYRLVSTSCHRPDECRFPLGDSIGQSGEDGFLITQSGLPPFVPAGASYWEIGTGTGPGAKATKDYRKLTEATDNGERHDAAFIFVTPLSGRRGWQRPAQKRWLKVRSTRGEWKEVRVVDGTVLVAWMEQFPAVRLWLAGKMGIKAQHIETPEQRWNELSRIGDPPPLPAKLLLANREAASEMLNSLFDQRSLRLKIDTRYPRNAADFVAAHVSTLAPAVKSEIHGRCLIATDIDAWSDLIALPNRHILVADFDIDDSNSDGMRLLENAKYAGHSVVYSGVPGGIPDLGWVNLASPKVHQVENALREGGYLEERARNLAQRANGDLNSLFRCIHGISQSPDWAQSEDATDLAIALLIGKWSDSNHADRAIVEAISGKEYGEWIARMREISLRPGTPLTHRDGNWKFVARYEGWHALGPRIFDEHLDQFQTAAISVLRERDPQFDLPPEERFASRVRGKVFAHSNLLRSGLAESLALLGSHPTALTSCTLGKVEISAIVIVRAVLADADWLGWASLNDLLPLLAEAAPGEFLDSVENAFNSIAIPFDQIFSQEGDGFSGGNYMSGLLWALETLAWDKDHLIRAMICLGMLAARDPGGQWSNRASNSLSTILLPWLPQTCASISKRGETVSALIVELPEVGWKLLMSLLPQSKSVSTGTRRPTWRETIPDDWSRSVTSHDYQKQITFYSEMAVTIGKSNRKRLADLIEHLKDLPASAYEQLLAHLGTDEVIMMSEADRLDLWNELNDLVLKHKKFSDAKWAMKPEKVDNIAAVAERLAPNAPYFRHQKLFSNHDFDLYEMNSNYDDQFIKLVSRRQSAIAEVAEDGGIQAVFAFAATVHSPWNVGIAFGVVADQKVDDVVLPRSLESEEHWLVQFAGGFVDGRFRSRGWQWVDDIDTSKWVPSQIGQFLAFLPFTPDTWGRSKDLLEGDESAYWSKASASPYETKADLVPAIDRLIQFGRPIAAIRCLQKMLHDQKPFENGRAVRALLAAGETSESIHSMDAYGIVEIIRTLQNDPATDPHDLVKVEWSYLLVLDDDRDASPKFLESQLANDPEFFCEMIRLVFRSKKDQYDAEDLSDERKRIASSAYRLLNKWRIPPGTRDDGTYHGDDLIVWLKAVRKKCLETGHLDMAMTAVGSVLVHVAADPDGFWINRSAATALNSKDAGDMRDGFRTALYNSRGVHTVDPTGNAERELEEKNRVQAEVTEAAGYHRLATTLRELADSYKHEAEWVSSRESFGD